MLAEWWDRAIVFAGATVDDVFPNLRRNGRAELRIIWKKGGVRIRLRNFVGMPTPESHDGGDKPLGNASIQYSQSRVGASKCIAYMAFYSCTR